MAKKAVAAAAIDGLYSRIAPPVVFLGVFCFLAFLGYSKQLTQGLRAGGLRALAPRSRHPHNSVGVFLFSILSSSSQCSSRASS